MRYIKILFVLSFSFFADEENLKNKIAKILPQGLPINFIETSLLPDFYVVCLLYTSPSPRDGTKSRMPSSA